MNIKPVFNTVLKFGKKHATKLLAGGAIATEVLGFWFMHKEAPEVRKKLDALPPDATLIDKVKTAGPVYLPAILMMMTSSGCIIGGCALGEVRLAAMTNLAMASEAALSRYEQKVIDTIGQEKATQIQDEIAKDLMHERPATQQDIIPTEHGTDVFYDPLSGRYFMSSETWINRCWSKINEKIDGIEMWAEVNEWYDELAIPQVGLGRGRGWNIEHRLIISIGEWESMPNGRPCRPILYVQRPVSYRGKED